MSWKTLLRWVLPSILGIAAGVSGTFLVSRASGVDPKPAAVLHISAATAAADPQVAARERRRLSQLEARLRSVEDSVENSRQPQSEKSLGEDNSAGGIEPDMQAAEAAHERAHLAQIERHSQESVDPVWSKQSDQSLLKDLTVLSHTQSFAIEKIDCRTTLCTATLEWPNKEAAKEALPAVVANRYALNCNKEMFLTESPAGAASYSATLVLDCEGFRANAGQ